MIVEPNLIYVNVEIKIHDQFQLQKIILFLSEEEAMLEQTEVIKQTVNSLRSSFC